MSVVFKLFKKRDWKKEVDHLASICSRLNGTFVPDDDEKVFACIVSDRGLNVSYFRDKDIYLVALTGDGIVMSTVSREMPEFFIATDAFALTVDKPEIVKAYTTSSSR